jgi:hypothetical protein
MRQEEPAMSSIKVLALCATVLATFLNASRAVAEFVPLSLASQVNSRLQDNVWGSIGMPASLLELSGTTVLAGVPFDIPVNGNNYWHSYQPPPGASIANPLDDNQPRVLSLTTNVENPARVYTLINTYWGEPGPNSYAKLEFFGTGGAYAELELVGGTHMRDFNSNIWENQSPNSINVLQWSGWHGYPTQRLDRQEIELPFTFHSETLTEIRLTDTGGWDRFDVPTNTSVQQRVFLAGITVQRGLIGDYNNDGAVDAADYVVWRKNEGTMATLPNDPHGGTIGPLQLDSWRANFGNMASSASSTSATVPEPGTVLLLILGSVVARLQRRSLAS